MKDIFVHIGLGEPSVFQTILAYLGVPGTIVCACHPSIQVVEAGEAGVQGKPLLKSCLESLRPA